MTMGLQRVGHDWVTELTELINKENIKCLFVRGVGNHEVSSPSSCTCWT